MDVKELLVYGEGRLIIMTCKSVLFVDANGCGRPEVYIELRDEVYDTR